MNFNRIATLLGQRQPDHALPQAFYQDPEILDFDGAAIFATSWLFAGFEVEVPTPGSVMTFVAGRTPIIILRDLDGDLRAFHNTCRHRGSELITGPCERITRITCPYHQWTYGLDGRLIGVPRITPGFDRDAYGLGSIHLESVAGTIFVCLADTPPDFAVFRAQLEPLLAPHELATKAKLAVSLDVVERANWKLVMENGRECYHCAVRHPDLRASFPVDYFADYNGPESVRRSTEFRARMAAAGLPTGPYEGDWWQMERFPLNDGVVSISPDGKPVSRLLLCDVADGDIGSLRLAVEPHQFCHFVSDYAVSFSAMPTGPQETLVRLKFLVHKDAVAGVDYDPDRMVATWLLTNNQDRDLAEANQRGVNSIGYRPGPYMGDAESQLIRLVNWYCDKAREYLEARLSPQGPVPDHTQAEIAR